jgi:hypothetical protein
VNAAGLTAPIWPGSALRRLDVLMVGAALILGAWLGIAHERARAVHALAVVLGRAQQQQEGA